MENIVIFDEFTDKDLRPADLLERYRRLTERDVKNLLLNSEIHGAIDCPACRSKSQNKGFDRYGLTYVECSDCGTLYVSPRPGRDALRNYYKKSEAVDFWRDQVSKYTIQKRREKIIRPRFQWIVDSVQEYLPKAESFADINTKQQEYVDEIEALKIFKKKILVDPYLRVVRPDKASGLQVVDLPWWQSGLKNDVDAVTIFEAGDHSADIDELLHSVKDMLRPGGLVFITTILISGFDLQILWDNAEYLFPPDRLNVFSVEGLKILFDRHGYECCELSTPGTLDVEIVEKALKRDGAINIPKFIRYLINQRGDSVKKSFQELLQSSLLSSYGKVLLRKKG